jgi:hypothetical protein
VGNDCLTETFDLTIANASSSENARLDNLSLTVTEAGEYSLVYGDYRLTLHSGIIGDADDNGTVDVSDVTLTVAVILNPSFPTDQYVRSQMDVDGNGVIDVSDVTAIVGMILQQTGE